MRKRILEKGFSAIEVTVIVVVVFSLVFGGWFFWQRHMANKQVSSPNKTSLPNNEAQTEQGTPPEPQKDVAYLEIKEWGVKAALPEDMRDVVTYKLGETVTDDDGNQLQNAEIMVLGSFLPGNDRCTLQTTPLGPSIDVATQYIRSESAKPFNAARYRASFKENVLKTSQYNYHLNYVTEPLCMDSSLDKVQELQAALINLSQ